jgi:hypothetical protein
MTTYTSPFAGDVIQPTDVSYAAYPISSDLTLVWPVNGNTSTDVAARIMLITPSTTSLSVYMPPADQISVGQDALITNPSAYALTIKNSTGSTIVSIAGGTSQYIYVKDNSTTGGTWGVIAFGATTSAANAASLAGLGLVASGTTLNQSHPSTSVTSGYTFQTTDRAQLTLWGGGSDTGTLPTAATLGDNWFTLFKNNGTGSFTIYTSGSDTIDLGTSKLFQPNEAAIILCTGTSYVTLGYGTSANFLFTAITKNVTGGSYTLTTAESTSVIQEYVGSLTSNVTVTYPPIVALYVVSNQATANSHTLTITTGVSGGANAVVPAGNQVTLICDGTNFYNANTVQAGASVSSLADGSTANPSLSFAAETTTGIYRPAAGWFGISILGTNMLGVNASGISVYGTGTFTGGVSGGVFS